MNTRYFFYGLFFSAIVAVSACSNSQKNTSASTETASKEKLDTADMRLARDLSVFCTLQAKAATLAQTKASTQKVKDFSKQNAELYKLMNEDLNRIATNYDIVLPATLNEKDDARFNKISAIKGASFDHAYLLEMLKLHNITIREINAARNIHCVPLKVFVVRNQSAIIRQAYTLGDLKTATP